MPTENGASLPTPANARGILTAIKSSISESIYTEFDVMGRVKAYRQATAGASQPYAMNYTYDLAGNLTTEQYPSGRVMTTQYDGAGRIAGVRQGSSYYAGGAPGTANSIQYAPQGTVAALRLGNSLWEHAIYDPQRLQPTQIGLGTSISDSSKLKLDYTYSTQGLNDNDGNIRTQKITAPGMSQPLVQSYTYDQLNRLRSAEETSGATRQWIQTFNYDRYGNRSLNTDLLNNQPKTTLSLVGPNPLVSPNTNRIIIRANSTEMYQYDNAGNQTKDQAGNTFAYDGENKQTRYTIVNTQTAAATYFYDGDGQRVKKVSGNVTTFFVYNAAGQLISEYSNAAPTVGGTRYVTADLLGSARAISDQAGTIVARYDYLPFGEEIGDYGGRGSLPGYGGIDQSRQKFTGYERDSETLLDFAQARYYHNQGGRFNSADPLLASLHKTNPQTFNRYAYCGNNPINCTDPSGLDWWYDPNETGLLHPLWYNDGDPIPEGYRRWDKGFVYWNSEDRQWWVLNPFKQEQRGFDTREEAEAQHSKWVMEGDPPYEISQFDGILEMSGYISGISGIVRGGAMLGGLMFSRPAATEVAAQATVQVFRVEGTVNTRLLISEAGSVGVQGEKTLFLNFGVRSRADEFFAKRAAQGMEGLTMKTFNVPRSFLDNLRSTAVLESEAASFATRPFIVDATKAVNQFGLRGPQINALKNSIIQGTGKVLKP